MTYHPLMLDLASLSDDRIQTRIAKIHRQMSAAASMPNGGQVIGQLHLLLGSLQAEAMRRVERQMIEEKLQSGKTAWSSDDGIEEID
jgi:hypothetical protein